MSKIAIFLADGFEEIEAFVPKDIFERANIETDLISINNRKEVIGTHNIKVIADKILDENFDSNDYDAIVFPGGMPGATNLEKNERLIEMVKKHNSKGKIIAAICASPAYILTKAGILDGKKATSYPGMEYLMNTIYKEENVVIDENIITSRGPATSFEFAYKIIEQLGIDTTKIKKVMLYKE